MYDLTNEFLMALQVREGEAPSYFNAVEATVLVELIEGLLASTQKGGARSVRPDDLGVMATYRKQVRCCCRIGRGFLGHCTAPQPFREGCSPHTKCSWDRETAGGVMVWKLADDACSQQVS